MRGPAPPAGLLPFSGSRRAAYHHGVPGAAFFDLDRTLLAGASGEVFSTAMRAAGFTSRSIPGEIEERGARHAAMVGATSDHGKREKPRRGSGASQPEPGRWGVDLVGSIERYMGGVSRRSLCL